MPRPVVGLLGTGAMLVASLTGCSSSPALSIDEYAAWCEGYWERVSEDRIFVTSHSPRAKFKNRERWRRIEIEEHESIVPPIELSALHDLNIAFYQFQSDVASRYLRIIEDAGIESAREADRILVEVEVKGLEGSEHFDEMDKKLRAELAEVSKDWAEALERFSEERKAFREELKDNLSVRDNSRLIHAGCPLKLWP